MLLFTTVTARLETNSGNQIIHSLEIFDILRGAVIGRSPTGFRHRNIDFLLLERSRKSVVGDMVSVEWDFLEAHRQVCIT